MKNLYLTTLIFAAVSIGCIPKHLQKYNQPDLTPSQSQTNQPASVTNSYNSPQQAPATPTIYSIGKQTFRFKIDHQTVWNSAINVLMANYNLNIVDKSSGVITTEWDSFYLDDAVYRNKISIFVKRVTWSMVDVIVYNNVEVLREYGDSPNATKLWLPAEKSEKEVGRIIQNMAINLNQPMPHLPPEMIAGSQKNETQGTRF